MMKFKPNDRVAIIATHKMATIEDYRLDDEREEYYLSDGKWYLPRELDYAPHLVVNNSNPDFHENNREILDDVQNNLFNITDLTVFYRVFGELRSSNSNKDLSKVLPHYREIRALLDEWIKEEESSK